MKTDCKLWATAVRRFRPITMTAAAAVLALIPLAREVFWAPMALAMMGGVIAATVLTLTFLPALRPYVQGRSAQAAAKRNRLASRSWIQERKHFFQAST